MQETEEMRSDPWVGNISWRRAWQPPAIFIPGESHGQRSLAGYSPWGHKESDTTELRLTLSRFQRMAFTCRLGWQIPQPAKYFRRPHKGTRQAKGRMVAESYKVLMKLTGASLRTPLKSNQVNCYHSKLFQSYQIRLFSGQIIKQLTLKVKNLWA